MTTVGSPIPCWPWSDQGLRQPAHSFAIDCTQSKQRLSFSLKNNMDTSIEFMQLKQRISFSLENNMGTSVECMQLKQSMSTISKYNMGTCIECMQLKHVCLHINIKRSASIECTQLKQSMPAYQLTVGVLPLTAWSSKKGRVLSQSKTRVLLLTACSSNKRMPFGFLNSFRTPG